MGNIERIERALTSWLRESVYALVAGALLPILVTGAAILLTRLKVWFGSPASYLWLSVVLAIGWSATLVWLLPWYRARMDTRRVRLLELARSLYKSDLLLGWLIRREDRRRYGEPLAKQLIEELLTQLRTLVAYGVPVEEKGSTFLRLTDDAEDAAFELYAHVNHAEPLIQIEVRQHLSHYRGLAGQALRENRCIIMRDCRHSDASLDWISTHSPPRFIGRAAVPVRAFVDGHSRDVGALCFDVKRPWLLGREDQELLSLFAEKIAALCVLLEHRGPRSASRLGRILYEISTILRQHR